MGVSMSKLDIEIEKNLRVFKAKLSDLKKDHKGRYVLMRHEEIFGIYDTIRDAQLTGSKVFEDGIFSVQKVTSDPVNLGFFSYAVPMAEA